MVGGCFVVGGYVEGEYTCVPVDTEEVRVVTPADVECDHVVLTVAVTGSHRARAGGVLSDLHGRGAVEHRRGIDGGDRRRRRGPSAGPFGVGGAYTHLISGVARQSRNRGGTTGSGMGLFIPSGHAHSPVLQVVVIHGRARAARL